MRLIKKRNIMPNYLLLELEVEFEGKRYKQPDCRIKTTPEGCVMILIRNEDNKWQGVRGKLFIKRFSLRKEFYIRKDRTKIPYWLIKIFGIKI